MLYTVWIPIVAVFYVFLGYMSYKNNTVGENWVYAIWLSGLFPGWALVSKYSNNLLLDGVLYDSIMGLGYIAGICYFTGAWKNLTLTNWTGLALTMLGIIMFKYKVG